MRRTKIVAPIGPASRDPRVLERLVRAGANVLRLNFSHGTHEGHAQVVRAAREIEARLGRPLALLQDLSGPKIRTGRVAGGEIGRLLTSFNEMVDRLRRQQSDLLRLEKVGAWRQMARSLAHEIKNPLTPIQLAAQQMRDAYPGDDPEYRELLTEGTEIIEEEVSGLRNMVTEFSQFARLPEPQMGEVRLDDLLTDLRSLYGPDQLDVSELDIDIAEEAA